MSALRSEEVCWVILKIKSGKNTKKGVKKLTLSEQAKAWV